MFRKCLACSGYISEFCLKWQEGALSVDNCTSLRPCFIRFSISTVDFVRSVKVIISVGIPICPFPKTRRASFPKHLCLLKAHSSVSCDVSATFANSTFYIYRFVVISKYKVPPTFDHGSFFMRHILYI